MRLRAADRVPPALCRQQFDCLLALLWAERRLVAASLLVVQALRALVLEQTAWLLRHFVDAALCT